MNIINIPRIRVNKLQYLGESSLDICLPLPEIETSVLKVKSAMDEFVSGMLREQASAAGKRELDLERDHLVSGFYKQVKAEEIFPNEDEAVIKTVKQIVQVINKYGSGIVRLPLDEESVAIDNLITEVKAIDLNPLKNTGIPRWLDIIDKSNNNFKSATGDYISKSAEVASTDSATKLAPALIDALEGMYAMLYAHIKINPKDNLKKAYAELETLVDSVK